MKNQEEKKEASKKTTIEKEKIDVAKVFGILGSKVRLQILKIIANEEKCVNFLSKNLKLSQPTISYHLGLLLSSGLVEQFKKAQWVRYKLNKNRLAELMGNFSRLYGILGLQKKQLAIHRRDGRDKSKLKTSAVKYDKPE